MADYVPEGMRGNVNIVPPAIDPLTPKNMALCRGRRLRCGSSGSTSTGR